MIVIRINKYSVSTTHELILTKPLSGLMYS